MATVDIARYEDTLVLHFGTEGARINAYTLATALQGIADAAKAANAIINPGYEVEIVVESFAAGSFRATLRAVLREAKNLFSAEAARNVILGVVATILYEHTLAPNKDITVQVNASEVIVVSGKDRIIVPRATYDDAKVVEQSPQFRYGISQAARAVEADPTISTFGLAPSPKEQPPVQIPRERIAALPAYFETDSSDVRVLEEITELQILRAILERSKRRWEFVWHGLRISAPVLDSTFFDDFFAHRFTIGPGDALRVRLRVRQRRTSDIHIFINESYEVVEVLEHIPRPKTTQLGME